MKRILIASLIIALALTTGAGMASAGEITGNGKLTPIKALQTEEHPAGPANSACAFSGYNDGYSDGSEPLRTQSFGTDGPSHLPGFIVSDFARSGALQGFGPGVNCRGGYFPPH